MAYDININEVPATIPAFNIVIGGAPSVGTGSGHARKTHGAGITNPSGHASKDPPAGIANPSRHARKT